MYKLKIGSHGNIYGVRKPHLPLIKLIKTSSFVNEQLCHSNISTYSFPKPQTNYFLIVFFS